MSCVATITRTVARAFLTTLALAACAGGASAATTTWIAPAGGNWNDASRWSAGVPTASDVAVLPAFRAGSSYSVNLDAPAFAKSFVIGDGNAVAVTITGAAPIAVSDSFDVRSGAALALVGTTMNGNAAARVGFDGAASMSVRGGANLTLKSLSIGVGSIGAVTVSEAAHVTVLQSLAIGSSGGDGTLVIRDVGSNCGSPVCAATCGPTGSGTIDVTVPGKLVTGTMSFGASSHFNVTIAQSPEAALVALGAVTYGGAIEVVAPADYVPTPGVPFFVTSTTTNNGSGTFASVTVPAFYGVALPLTYGPFGVMVQTANPVVQFTVTPSAIVTYPGFAAPISIQVTLLSGASQFCCNSDVGFNAVVDPPIATLQGAGSFATVKGISAGVASMTLSAAGPNGPTTQVVPITVGAQPPAVFDRVSEGSNGEQGIYSNPEPPFSGMTPVLRMSEDGRFVVFTSCDSALLGQPGWCELLIKDRATGELSIASRGTDGVAGDRISGPGDVSADGRYVAFASEAMNWGGPPPAPESWQVWYRDRQANVTTLVSRAPDGSVGNGQSLYPRISADGRYVVFASRATNLDPRDTNGYWDIYRFDATLGTLELVSMSSDGASANGDSYQPVISDDGDTVVFTTYAKNLVPGDTNQLVDVVVRHVASGLTTRASVATDGTQSNAESLDPDIDGAARFVVFHNKCTTWGTSGTVDRVWLRDLWTSTTSLMSTASDGSMPNAGGTLPAISANGAFVLFASYANLAGPAASSGGPVLYRKHRMTGHVDAVSTNALDTLRVDVVYAPSLSADGRTIAFSTSASNLTPNDTNNVRDVFARTYPATNADLNADGAVNVVDLNLLFDAWNTGGGSADLDGDGVVGAGDLAILLGNWS